MTKREAIRHLENLLKNSELALYWLFWLILGVTVAYFTTKAGVWELP